jgi:IS5 family transposase
MARPRDDRQPDLFRSAREQIIDMSHPVVRLAEEIDWGLLDRRLGELYFTRLATVNRRCQFGWWPAC